jgi:hypothetical protein
MRATGTVVGKRKLYGSVLTLEELRQRTYASFKELEKMNEERKRNEAASNV